jgi:D-lactate dehydrogenase (cytochrome)
VLRWVHRRRLWLAWAVFACATLFRSEALLRALEDLGALLDDAVLLPPERAWGLRHAVSEALARAGEVLGLDVSVPRSALADVREEVADVVRRSAPAAVLADFGHVGDGGLHLNLVLRDGAGTAAKDALRTAVYEVVARHGGSFSAEHGLGPVNIGWWAQHASPGARTALAAVKRAVDPYGLLGTDALRAAFTTTEGSP